MIVNDFFKVFCLFEVSIEFDPVLFDDLLRKVIDKTLDKVDYLVVSDIRPLEALNIGFFGTLKLDPARIKLSLKKLKPKHESEKTLVLGNILLVEYEAEGERALEI